MKFLFATLAMGLATLAFSQQLPSVGGTAVKPPPHDLEWITTPIQKEGWWKVEHALWVKNPAGHTRIRWEPNIYNGWFLQNKEKETVSSFFWAAAKPEKQGGIIQYGDLKTPKPATSYRIGEENPEKKKENSCPGSGKEGPFPAEANVSLTIKMGETFPVLHFKLVSEVKDGRISYSINLKQKPEQKGLEEKIRLDWKAAASPELRNELLKQHKASLIHLDAKGKARYEIQIPANAKPILRSGALVVTDVKGDVEFGGVQAPAYTISLPPEPPSTNPSAFEIRGKIVRLDDKTVSIVVAKEIESRDYPLAKDVKVFMMSKEGKLPVEEGLKVTHLQKIDPQKGVPATLVAQDKRITEIVIGVAKVEK